MRHITLLAVLLAFAQTPLSAQNSVASDSALFDFWIGEWELSWKDAAGKTLTGTNRISRKWNNVLEEDFATSDRSFVGGSQSVYNKKQNSWKQTWTDNQGAYIAFTGKKNGDNRIFATEAVKQGKETVVQQMVFSNITPDAFTWDWQRSGDGGKTWTSQWLVNYQRRKPVVPDSIKVLRLAEGETSAPASLKDLAFLDGFWKGPGLGGDCDELWLPATDSSKAGIFRLVTGGKIAFSEYMVIEQQGETLRLRLKHFGRDLSPWEEKDQWTTFRFIKLDGVTAYFHGLTYHRNGDELIIRLQLRRGGALATETFRFRRAAL
jgi:hypothetical protein